MRRLVLWFLLLLLCTPAHASVAGFRIVTTLINAPNPIADFDSARLNQTGFGTYSRLGVVNYAPLAGGLVQYPADTPPAEPFRGVLLEGAGNNLVTCVKQNPSSLTGVNKGTGSHTLSWVDDSANLLASGAASYGPKVYLVNNTGQASIAVTGLTGTNATTNKHTLSIFARGSGSIRLSLNGNNPSAWMTLSNTYQRFTLEGYTPTATGQNFWLEVSAGGNCYWIMPNLLEGNIATTLIGGASGTTARSSSGSDTSNTGVQKTISSEIEAALTGANNKGVLLQQVFIPWSLSQLDASATVSILTPTNSAASFLYINNGLLKLRDGTNTASVSLPATAGYYTYIVEWSAAQHKMRCGVFSLASRTTQFGAWATYTGSFPIYTVTKRLRWCYGLGSVPLYVGKAGLFDQDPWAMSDSDAQDLTEALYFM